MISNQTTFYLTRIGGYQPDQPVHPTFLYEFIGNMLIFILLLAIRRRNKTPFRVLLYYFLLYGIMRFFVEAVRTDSLYIPNTDLRVSMVISAVMVVFSLILLMVLRQRQQRNELKRHLESDIETDETSSAPADPTDETVSESVLTVLRAMPVRRVSPADQISCHWRTTGSTDKGRGMPITGISRTDGEARH